MLRPDAMLDALPSKNFRYYSSQKTASVDEQTRKRWDNIGETEQQLRSCVRMRKVEDCS